jgi:chitinase
MPCKNGACCRSDGLCGYCDEFCAASVCLSNCDAQAECGRCAPTGKGDCPLKVCCSKFGFCGTTPDFCDAGCQTAFGGCGPAPKATCTMSTSKIRNIAYYESWAMTRACDKVSPEDLDLTGLTHVNFGWSAHTSECNKSDHCRQLSLSFTQRPSRLRRWMPTPASYIPGSQT